MLRGFHKPKGQKKKRSSTFYLGLHITTPRNLFWAFTSSVCASVLCIYLCGMCVSDEPLPHFMAPPIPSSPRPSSYQFDWMICNMSPLIWFGATVGVSGFSRLLPPPGVWGAGGCVGMDTGGRANEVSSWWDYVEVLMGRGTRAQRIRESKRNTTGKRETWAHTDD